MFTVVKQRRVDIIKARKFITENKNSLWRKFASERMQLSFQPTYQMSNSDIFLNIILERKMTTYKL